MTEQFELEEVPLFIPSYNRYPLPPTAELAMHCLGDDYPWWVVVRKSQFRDYDGVPTNHLLPVADHRIDNVGKTRNFIWQFAYDEGWNYIFDWDDDINGIGHKLAEGRKYIGYRKTGNKDPWLDGTGFWDEAGRLAQETFHMYPCTVAGSIQNQRWPSTDTVRIQHGKTPRRTKILNVERIVENNLLVPEEFYEHGDDIGSLALWLKYGWQVFTICSLTYTFVPETDKVLPSTLRDRDEELNRAIHAEEYENLMRYPIKDYLRVNKKYDDGSYMYGDVNWTRYRKVTGDVSYTHEFSHIKDQVPLWDIPVTVKE